jgi:hypothetical protein
MSDIQAVLFDKRKNWTTTKAKRWLNKHHLKPIKEVHETKNELRYRIQEPNSKRKMRIMHFGKDTGIEAVLMF